MTRFEILALLHRAPDGLTLTEIGRNSQAPNWYSHTCRCATRTQLNRLVRWGLAFKTREFSWTPAQYLISKRGKERLAWAIRTGKLNPHPAAQ
jgi:hypothetical protein